MGLRPRSLNLCRFRCSARFSFCLCGLVLFLFLPFPNPRETRHCIIRLGTRHHPSLMAEKIDARRALAACSAIELIADIEAHGRLDLLRVSVGIAAAISLWMPNASAWRQRRGEPDRDQTSPPARRKFRQA